MFLTHAVRFYLSLVSFLNFLNHSFQINSLVRMMFPPPLGELLCGGKNSKAKNDHKSFLREH
jgi:hypothetical protein